MSEEPTLFTLADSRRAIGSLKKQASAMLKHGECFECRLIGQCHQHHVVPRSRGGTRMVLLCERCHGKVHDRNFEKHTTLVRLGIQRAKDKGVKLGRPGGLVKGADAMLTDHADIVRLLKKGYSVRNVAAIAEKSTSTVAKVKKLLRE